MQVRNIRPELDIFGAALLAGFCFLTVLHEFLTANWPVFFAFVFLILYLALDLRSIKASVWMMMFAMLATVIASLVVFGPRLDIFLPAFERGAFIAFFVISLTTLRIPCQRSAIILNLGNSIVQQPEGRRYLSMAFGAQLFGVLLNIGAIGLLGTAARRSVNPGPDGVESDVDQARLKQMTLSILRGFAPLAIWSPTSVTLIVIIETFPDLTWYTFLPYALGATAAFVGLGWIFDRAARTGEAVARKAVPSPGLGAVFLRAMPIIFGIALFAWVLTKVLGVSNILALTISVPLSSAIWLLMQILSDGEPRPIAALGGVVQREFTRTSQQMRPEVGIFLAAGVMSVLIGPLFDIDGMISQLLGMGVPSNVLLLGVSLLVFSLAAVGVSPFLTAMLMASTLSHVEGFGVPTYVTALALMMAWAGSLSISSFMAVTRLLAACVDRPVNLICLGWNLKFALTWMGLVAVWILIAAA
ncbi:hypothetical protein [Thalassovita taeanensis]|uniref:hypothetical protein n=1 Tax=Thalassovita taeanensis TaxID=657014 RepID=UPI001114A688|nr:hypothetical protein [Thalassovita taeanensis]